jgi:protocatechuate 3,4-dioxygenase beta subunit
MDWQTVTHQVALSGRVTDAASGDPLAGARVEVIDGPAEFTSAQAVRARDPAWSTRARRPGRATTGADGVWYMDDLPPGTYSLRFTLPRAAGVYAGAVVGKQVLPRDGGGVIAAVADAELAPTLLSGRVTAGGAPLAMAEVSLRGSAERAVTGADGRWRLAGVEPGARQLRVAAAGHQPATRDLTLASPGAARVEDVELEAL